MRMKFGCVHGYTVFLIIFYAYAKCEEQQIVQA